MNRLVTVHIGPDRDFHEHIEILAGSRGIGGTSEDYKVVLSAPNVERQLAALKFQTQLVAQPADINGVTNEVLLAIVLDRLRGFQAGLFPCPENDEAVLHVKAALEHLQARSQRRKANGLESKHAEHTFSDPKFIGKPVLPVEEMIHPSLAMKKEDYLISLNRVEKTETDLIIRGPDFVEKIPLKSLEAWGGWSRVESAAKRLANVKQHLTREEMDIVQSCATGKGGPSGFAEFAQAYGQHVAG